MQATYTTDNQQPTDTSKLVERLASVKGVSEDEAARLILGGDYLAKWRESRETR